MTASQAATQADRLHERLLAACWPPPERKGRPCQQAAPQKIQQIDKDVDTTGRRADQRPEVTA